MTKRTIAIMLTILMIGSMAACTRTAETQVSENTIVSSGNAETASGADTNAGSETQTDSKTQDNSQSESAAESKTDDSTSSSDGAIVEYTVNTAGKLDTADLFSKRDLTQTADLSEAKSITASDNKTETITEAGVYVISGSAKNFTIKVEADKEAKVQLVLDGLEVTNESTPVIYIVSADKCFITTVENSTSTLSVTGSFKADGETNTDAVIFSKDDVVLNGLGTLTINSAQGNGISGKDDIKITGGTYNITSALDSIEAHESISVYAGTFNINSSKDGFHSENNDDDTVGCIYIYDGVFNITAKSDAIQATTVAQIDGGKLTLNASEGIEATYVQINGGNINIDASDDGINGSQKSKSYSTPTIEFNGGTTTIVMGQGDTDAVDANGNIIVNGGTIDITAQVSSFDYDGTATYNGGTVIINGTQVDSIPQSMMGGGMGGRMNGGMGTRGGMTNRNFNAQENTDTVNGFTP